MKPLLAHVYEPTRITFPCFVQPKLNGIRALYQDGCFQSRDLLPWGEGILAHLSSELIQLFPPETVLDGELYVHGWSLQRINGAVTPIRKERSADTSSVEYHIFDTVSYTKSFEERFANLNKGTGQFINVVPSYKVNNAIEADKLYAQFVSAGFEGMMYRLGDCPYTVPKQPFFEHPLGSGSFGPNKSRALSDKDNRCWHLLKRKDWQDDEFEIVSTEEGEGKRSNMVGALVMKTRTGKVFKTGTGLSDGEAIAYFENPPIGRFAKIKFLVYSDEGIPMNSSIIAIL